MPRDGRNAIRRLSDDVGLTFQAGAHPCCLRGGLVVTSRVHLAKASLPEAKLRGARRARQAKSAKPHFDGPLQYGDFDLPTSVDRSKIPRGRLFSDNMYHTGTMRQRTSCHGERRRILQSTSVVVTTHSKGANKANGAYLV